MSVKINSYRYGQIEVSDDKVIEFPAGLPGFENLHRYALCHIEGEESKYFILHSLDDPNVALSIADPTMLGFSYEIKLNDEMQKQLGQPDTPEATADNAVMVILTKNTDGELSANLKAPLILNLNTKRGIQYIFAKLDYSL
ncbi:MAG TPA: flagellar assembly protein FliW [Rhodocyclaceae bacterium]|nr:flagellar assembly protein FliW [Rhodocyclaceae bacterium]